MHYLLTSWAIAGVDELAKQIDSFREVLRARTRDTHDNFINTQALLAYSSSHLGWKITKRLYSDSTGSMFLLKTRYFVMSRRFTQIKRHIDMRTARII